MIRCGDQGLPTWWLDVINGKITDRLFIADAYRAMKMIRYEIHYETGDSWWWQATEDTRAAAERRLQELQARFPTREWRIQEIDDDVK